jgi:hypothetical protein
MTRAEVIALLDPIPADRDRYSKRGAALDAAGFTYLGAGVIKRAWKSPCGTYVVRLHNTNLDGSPTNGACEERNYNDAPPKVWPYFLQVEQHTGYQLQAFATPGKTCAQSGCDGYPDGVVDSHPQNHIHDTEGRPIYFDYGHPNAIKADNPGAYWNKHPDPAAPAEAPAPPLGEPIGNGDPMLTEKLAQQQAVNDIYVENLNRMIGLAAVPVAEAQPQ